MISRTNLVAMIVATAFFMQTLDTTIVATALPDIARSFGTSPVHLSSAITAYILSIAVFIPISGWLSDRFGSRTVFQTAILVFSLGSILCGLANNVPELTVARLLQGMGGAMLVPVGRAVVLRTAKKSEMVKAMAFLSVPAQLGPVIGPPLGGFITTYASWRWIFLINVPVGLLGIILATRHVENYREPGRAPLDWSGFCVTGVALAAMMWAMDAVGRGSTDLLAPAAAGAVGLGLTAWAVFHARHFSHPLVDFRLLRLPTFWMNFTPGSLYRAGAGSLQFLLPLMFQTAFGMSPVQAGSLTFASAVGAISMRVNAPQALRRFGFRNILIWNGLIAAVTIAVNGFFTPSTPAVAIIGVLLIGGFFQSLQLAALNTIAYVELAPTQMSAATSLAQLMQQFGKGFGIALSAVILHLSMLVRHADQVGRIDFTVTFLGVALIALVGVPMYGPLSPTAGDDVTGHHETSKGEPAIPKPIRRP